jgi:hypothetical protein
MGIVSGYDLKNSDFILNKISSSNILPAEKITVKIGYTNGTSYPNRAEFYIKAVSPGSFAINYVPGFNTPGKGMINFTVEAADKGLEIIRDFSLNSTAPGGRITVTLPRAGLYKLSVVSKYRSSADLVISCNGNYFYKNSAFLGNKTENYRSDLTSLPGFFYVPAGLQKIYFSVNNSNSGGLGFASANEISKAFVFKDSYGNRVEPNLVSAHDSALFFINVPAGQQEAFWQVFKMEQYNLCFANINNMLVYGKRKQCTSLDFMISIHSNSGNCLTHLSAISNPGTELKWEIYDNGRWMYFGNEHSIDLPDYVSPNSIVTLISGEACSISKRIADAPGYYQAKQACASGAPIPNTELSINLFPNPSNGIYNIQMNGTRRYADEIIITDFKGCIVFRSKNCFQPDLSAQPSGIYIYRILIDDKLYYGKLIKL